MTYWTPPDPGQQYQQYPHEQYQATRPRRRRRVLWGLGAGVVAAGGITAGVLAATSGSSSRSSATPLPATTAPASPSTTAPAHRPAVHTMRGKIEAEQGSTWTLDTAKGATVRVTITPTTAWGTRAAPASQAQFVTGDTVVVRGVRSNGTVTATRVAKAPAPTG